MPIARPLVLLGLAVLAAAFVPAALAQPKVVPLTDAPADALTRALTTGELSEAEYALERARALFRPMAVERRYGELESLGSRAATFVLRDLALRLEDLEGGERAAARRLLARPSDGPADIFGDGWTTSEAPQSPVCEPRGTPRWCVHWVDTTEDAPPAADGNSDDVPDWIDGTVAALDKVFDVQVDGLRFPRPQNDSDSLTNPDGNPNGALDVYLADIGDDSLYGYCTTDDPDAAEPGVWAVSAYCVVDNDFRPGQFGGVNGQAANKVTLAHEVHHAEQFALDAYEDTWLMEGMATALERVVYPGIRDNYQYLDTSQIEHPGIPLDFGDPRSGSVYGNWIFFQYLSEHLGGPEIFREIWRKLDAREGRPDASSTQGVKQVLVGLRRTLRGIFAGFTLANRRPRDSYDLPGLPWLESPTHAHYRLGRGARREDTLRPRHLSARWLTFHRTRTTPRRANLVLRLELPTPGQGGAARAVVVKRSGSRTVFNLALGSDGEGRRALPFGRKVRRVELALVNAGARFACWEGSYWSCQGEPLDDGRPYSFRASLR